MKGKKTLFMAVVACVFMFAAATGALALVTRTAADPIESGTAPVYTSFLSAEDYLVDVDGVVTYASDLEDEELFLVKRASDLKATEFIPPGNSPTDYTKVVYVVNLKLRELDLFTGGVAGLAVSDLAIGGFGAKTPSLKMATVTLISGADVFQWTTDDPEYAPSAYDDTTGTLSIQVKLPSLEVSYKEGDMVSIFLMFKTPEIGLTLTGIETGFPDYQ